MASSNCLSSIDCADGLSSDAANDVEVVVGALLLLLVVLLVLVLVLMLLVPPTSLLKNANIAVGRSDLGRIFFTLAARHFVCTVWLPTRYELILFQSILVRVSGRARRSALKVVSPMVL